MTKNSANSQLPKTFFLNTAISRYIYLFLFKFLNIIILNLRKLFIDQKFWLNFLRNFEKTRFFGGWARWMEAYQQFTRFKFLNSILYSLLIKCKKTNVNVFNWVIFNFFINICWCWGQHCFECIMENIWNYRKSQSASRRGHWVSFCSWLQLVSNLGMGAWEVVEISPVLPFYFILKAPLRLAFLDA